MFTLFCLFDKEEEKYTPAFIFSSYIAKRDENGSNNPQKEFIGVIYCRK
jgi:hypothetical protein